MFGGIVTLVLTAFAEAMKAASAFLNFKRETYYPEKCDAVRDQIFTIQEDIDRETRTVKTGDTIRLRLLNQRLRDKQDHLQYLLDSSGRAPGSTQGNANSN